MQNMEDILYPMGKIILGESKGFGHAIWAYGSGSKQIHAEPGIVCYSIYWQLCWLFWMSELEKIPLSEAVNDWEKGLGFHDVANLESRYHV